MFENTALIWVVVLIIIAFSLYALLRKPSREDDGDSEQIPDATVREIQRIIARKSEMNDAAWRSEPPSSKQIEYLSNLGVYFGNDITLTKGKASEIIGLFNEPDDEDLEIIEFFDIDMNPKNETEARRIVSKIFSDEEKRARWEHYQETGED